MRGNPPRTLATKEIEPYRVSDRLIARDVGLGITVTRCFAYSRTCTSEGYFIHILMVCPPSFSRYAHVFGEYFSCDTKVSEFADVENVSIAALMHVFMHGRARASTRVSPRDVCLVLSRIVLSDTGMYVQIR